MNLTTRLFVALIPVSDYHRKTGFTRNDLITLKK